MALVLLNQTSKQMKRKEIIKRIDITLENYSLLNKKTKQEKGYIIALNHFKTLLELK